MFSSTYFNLPGFQLLKADEARPHRLKFEGHDYRYDVTARVWRIDPEGQEMLVLRAWIHGLCRHLVLDADTGVVLADGFERREVKSWEQARTRVEAIRQQLA
jgi:hypothetical protein